LLASLAEAGQQTPIVVVAVAGQPDRYRVIDGFKRIAALGQLRRDTVDAVVWPMTEADALVLDRAMRSSEPESALEQGWLLAELEHHFGFSLEDLARRFDRSVSWVSRRLALVELLPESVQQQVRDGRITPHVAMKCLVPLARANPDDCPPMAQAFARSRFSSREAGQIYAAWRDASPAIRQRILDSPELFLKARHRTTPEPAVDRLLRDLDLVGAIAGRARRRWVRAGPLLSRTGRDQARDAIGSAVSELTRLAERIPQEESDAEPDSTGRDSGTPSTRRAQPRDRPGVEGVAPVGAQSAAVELRGRAGAGPAGEGRTLAHPDPGADRRVQGEPRPGA
jgi:ParB/RepB/Spo0J family partition protein